MAKQDQVQDKEVIRIRVVSTNLETNKVEVDKIIDHINSVDRQWLGKHCYWAFRNNRRIETYPVSEHEAANYKTAECCGLVTFFACGTP